jgi:hypothetical protein
MADTYAAARIQSDVARVRDYLRRWLAVANIDDGSERQASVTAPLTAEIPQAARRLAKEARSMSGDSMARAKVFCG